MKHFLNNALEVLFIACADFSNYKSGLFHGKFFYLSTNKKYNIKVTFLIFHLKNVIMNIGLSFKVDADLFHLHLSVFQRAYLKCAIFGLAFVSNQSFSLFFFFIGQDAELSGTLSLVLTQCCKRIKDTVQKLASDHKDIHSSVSRVGKAIDKVWC